MFRAGLLLIIRRINWYKQQLVYVIRCVDWLLAAASQHNEWHIPIAVCTSWSSWWWAASLLETCRGLLL